MVQVGTPNNGTKPSLSAPLSLSSAFKRPRDASATAQHTRPSATANRFDLMGHLLSQSHVIIRPAARGRLLLLGLAVRQVVFQDRVSGEFHQRLLVDRDGPVPVVRLP